MEKFMIESDNNMTQPITLKTSIVLDRQNLINILEKDNDNTHTKKSEKEHKQKSAYTTPVSRRKIDEKSNHCNEPRKSKRESNNNKSSSSKTKKRKLSNFIIKSAVICTYKRPVLHRVLKPIEFHCPKKKNAKRYIVKKKIATVNEVILRNDFKIVPNINKIIKREVPEIIDLTESDDNDGDNGFVMTLYFAKIIDIPLEQCEVIRQVIEKAVVEIEPSLIVAEQYKPEVCYELHKAVIDLTDCDDVVVSEKECVNVILHLIHEFYEAYQVLRRIEIEVAEIFATEDPSLNPLFQKGKKLGATLIHNLNTKRINNLDVNRFLSIIVFKLEQTMSVFISPTEVALYLYLMLNQNKNLCDNQLLQDLLQETTKILEMTAVKLEGDQNLFTEEQLTLLRLQIQKYHELLKFRFKIKVSDDFLGSENGLQMRTGDEVGDIALPSLYFIKQEE